MRLRLATVNDIGVFLFININSCTFDDPAPNRGPSEVYGM